MSLLCVAAATAMVTSDQKHVKPLRAVMKGASHAAMLIRLTVLFDELIELGRDE